jgi:hypothetical protein
MVKLPVTSTGANMSPAIGFDEPDHIANLHHLDYSECQPRR